MPSIGYQEQDDMDIHFINYGRYDGSNERIVVTKEKANDLFEYYKSCVPDVYDYAALNEAVVAINGEVIQGNCLKYYGG